MKTSLWRRSVPLSSLGQRALLMVLLLTCLAGCQVTVSGPVARVTPTPVPATPTPPAPQSPSPTSTLSPNPNILYQADWSGGLADWRPVGTDEWSTHGAQLISNGPGRCLIVAQYAPSPANYAV